MTELTDKMRTCAAYIMSRPHDAPMPTEHLLDDAAGLLNSAADLLEATSADLHPIALGEPMEIIPPPPPGFTIDRTPSAMWTDNELPQSTPRRANACPKCDSRAGKTVRKVSKVVMLVCPVCDHSWKY